MNGNNRNTNQDEEGDENRSSSSSSVVDLYSILNLDRNATEEDIHRSYRILSTTFHPDKIPYDLNKDEIEQTFLDFKKAHEILIDPVLRLTYDNYGENGVGLIKKIQLQQHENKARKEKVEVNEEEDDEDDEDELDDDGDDDIYNLYERLERLLVKHHNPIQAKEELHKFMLQHSYHEHLSEDNQVHLNLSIEFPPVYDLKSILRSGKQNLNNVERRIRTTPTVSEEERQHYKERIIQERRLIDYQFSKLKDGQQAEIGFTLSSVQPRNATTTMTGGTPIHPKWSMAMGASTNLIYPGVTSIMQLASKQQQQKGTKADEGQEQHHPVSMFVNTVYQPIPATQINLTANLSNDNSHQFTLGSAHTFANQTVCRYSMTLLSNTSGVLKTPLIFNLKTYRHLQNIGMTSFGLNIGGNGDILQCNTKWEAHRNNQKYIVKATTGMLQGNSIELSYKTKFPKSNHWLKEYIMLPKKFEVSTIFGRVHRISAMITQEFTSLATHPTLGFGMEHDISLGRWTWIWEFRYNDSTFRVPIPVVHLGSVGDPNVYYSRKLYHAIYSLLFQSMLADLLHDPEWGISNNKKTQDNDIALSTIGNKIGMSTFKKKSQKEAEQQLELMKPTAEKKQFLESQRQNGLCILKATYWSEVCSDDAGMTTEIMTMDATKQLQFWVFNGKLSASTNIPKSSWMGFYNLQSELTITRKSRTSNKWDWRIWKFWTRRQNDQNVSSKSYLTIRYKNNGKVYELTVGETEPFVLPCNEQAECLGDASFVK